VNGILEEMTPASPEQKRRMHTLQRTLCRSINGVDPSSDREKLILQEETDLREEISLKDSYEVFLSSLTPELAKWVDYIRLGYSNKEISQILNVSTSWVSVRMKQLKKVFNRAFGDRPIMSIIKATTV
jgi:DNA-binding NarL/FixJ family response regulator